jgi:hypothetical protein
MRGSVTQVQKYGVPMPVGEQDIDSGGVGGGSSLFLITQMTGAIFERQQQHFLQETMAGDEA